MFSDTHCHIRYLAEQNEKTAQEILLQLAHLNTPFVQDIGTKCDDLIYRVTLIQSIVEATCKNSVKNDTSEVNNNLKKQLADMLYFSAGIWPSVEEINSREESIKQLEKQIDMYRENSCNSIFSVDHLISLGECGLDHHWNPSGVDGRKEDDFNTQTLNAEAELFEMQLLLAKKKMLPVIVHSRDAFEDTVSCIKNIGYNKGVIHCYSYGINEAKQFLDLGWYISFSGSITYTKKRDIETMAKLIKYIPQDRLLCETDSPYLAPVPFRGRQNNPVLVEYVYKYVAEKIGMKVEKLSEVVYKNALNLFIK